MVSCSAFIGDGDVLKIETEKLDQTVKRELTELQKMKAQDYSRFSNREVLKLQTMINNSQSLAVRINELILFLPSDRVFQFQF